MKRVITLCLLASLTLTSLSAIAADQKMYPGTNCHTNNEQSIEYFYTRAFNASNGYIYFDCPIVKDDLYGNVDNAWAWIMDVHPSQDANCQYFCINSATNGLSGWFSNSASTSGSSGTPQLIGMGGIHCTANHSLSMACRIPGRNSSYQKSGLTAYRVDE